MINKVLGVAYPLTIVSLVLLWSGCSGPDQYPEFPKTIKFLQDKLDQYPVPDEQTTLRVSVEECVLRVEGSGRTRGKQVVQEVSLTELATKDYGYTVNASRSSGAYDTIVGVLIPISDSWPKILYGVGIGGDSKYLGLTTSGEAAYWLLRAVQFMSESCGNSAVVQEPQGNPEHWLTPNRKPPEAFQQCDSERLNNDIALALDRMQPGGRRQAAVERLGEAGQPCTYEALRALFDDEFELQGEKQHLVLALGRSSRDDSTNRLLMRLAEDSDQELEIRKASVTALGEGVRDEAVTSFLVRLAGDSSQLSDLRYDALKGLQDDAAQATQPGALHNFLVSIAGNSEEDVNLRQVALEGLEAAALSDLKDDAAQATQPGALHNFLVSIVGNSEEDVRLRQVALKGLEVAALSPEVTEVLFRIVENCLDSSSLRSTALDMLLGPAADGWGIVTVESADGGRKRIGGSEPAIDALGSPARVDKIVDLLVNLVAAPDEDVTLRYVSARALGHFSDAPHVPDALIGALDAAEWSVRAWVLSSIGQYAALSTQASSLQPLASPTTVSRMIALLADEHDAVRESAAGALGDLAGFALAAEQAEILRPALEPLRAAKRDQVADVRDAASSAYGEISRLLSSKRRLDRGESQAEKPSKAPTPTTPEGTVASLIAVVTDAKASIDARVGAANGLGQQGSKSALDALLRLLKHSRPELRIAAVDNLTRLNAQPAVPWIIQLLGDGNPGVRREAAWALGTFRAYGASSALIGLLGDTDTLVRFSAATTLGRLHGNGSASASDDVRRALVKAIADSEPMVAWTAAWALGETRTREYPDADSVPGLITLIEGPGQDVPFAPERITGFLRDASAPEVLPAVLADVAFYPRAMAAAAIGKAEDPRALETLFAALRDRNAFVRFNAAWAIGQIAYDERTTERLIAQFAPDDLKAVAEHYAFFLEYPDLLPNPMMIVALRRFGTQAMREAFSASGREALTAAASRWRDRQDRAPALGRDPVDKRAAEKAMEIAGIYRRSIDISVWDEGTGRSMIPYRVTDSLMVIPQPPASVSFDLYQLCFLGGEANFEGDAFVYRDDPDDVTGQPTTDCVLRIEPWQGGIRFQSHPACDDWCSKFGSFHEMYFPSNTRLVEQSTPITHEVVKTSILTGDFADATLAIQYLLHRQRLESTVDSPSSAVSAQPPPLPEGLSLSEQDWISGMKQAHKQALAQFREKNLEQAVYLLRYAVELLKTHHPDLLERFPWLMNDYGFFLEQTGLYARAETVLRDVLQQFPDRTVARLNLADALWYQKKTEEAVTQYMAYAKHVSQDAWPDYLAKRCPGC